MGPLSSLLLPCRENPVCLTVGLGATSGSSFDMHRMSVNLSECNVWLVVKKRTVEKKKWHQTKTKSSLLSCKSAKRFAFHSPREEFCGRMSSVEMHWVLFPSHVNDHGNPKMFQYAQFVHTCMYTVGKFHTYSCLHAYSPCSLTVWNGVVWFVVTFDFFIEK